MMNTGLLLRRSYRDLNGHVVMAIMLGLIPTLLLGFYWLDQVGRDQVSLLRTIIGAMVLVAGMTLMLRPSPYSSLSAKPFFWLGVDWACLVDYSVQPAHPLRI